MKRNPTKTTPIIISYGRELKGLINNFQAKALTIIPRIQREYVVRLKKLNHQLIENSLVSEIDRIIAELEYQEIQSRLRPIVRRYTGQAYTKGALKAIADLRRVRYEISFAYTPSDLKAVEMMIDHNLIEIKGMEEYMKKEVMRVLSTGMLEGWGNQKIAKDMIGRIDISRDRAVMIARTETIRNYNQASVERYKNAGLDQWRWITAMDERACEECMANDNEIFDMGDEQPPLHPNCFLEGTRFKSPGGIISGLRVWYDGDIIELHFSSGSQLSVTPNHLILTPQGFAAAQFLNIGDNIFYCPDFERIVTSDPDDDGKPSTVKNIFDTLIETSACRPITMPCSSEYLHGDGKFIKSDIKIVRSNRFLEGARNSSFLQHFGKYNFSPTDIQSFKFSGFSPLAQLFMRAAFATDGGMSGLRQSNPFFSSRLAHSNKHRFAASTWRNSGISKTDINNTTGNVIFRCQGFDRQSTVIQTDNFINVERSIIDIPCSSGLDIPFSESFTHSFPIDTKNICDIINSSSALIKTDKIIDIKVKSFHGFVYDFQTITTLCIGNSIITSNCRCATSPYINENLTPSPEE